MTDDLFKRLAALKGLISPTIGEALYKRAKNVPENQVIVEIGSYLGKSTSYLAAGAQAGNGARVWAVDPWSEDVSEWRRAVMERIPSPVYEDFLAQVTSMDLQDHITTVRATSIEAARTYDGPPIGLLYIDGDHSERAASADFRVWSKFLAAGAIVAFDDFNTPGNPGVTATVRRLEKARCIKRVAVLERLVITRFKKMER